MYEQILQQVGLAKNEAQIYETLLREGASSVGRIAVKSGVHRRNVYDSLKRLVNRGLAYEILGRKESVYEAAEPEYLEEMLEVQQRALEKVMPGLENLYQKQANRQTVMIYRGPEGWKNYMRDMLSIADEAHFIAAKGGWLDERVKNFFPVFEKQAVKKGMRYYHLFDWEIKEELPQILPHVGDNYRFLPKGFSAPGAIDIFGDHVNLIPDVKLGRLGEEIRFIVIVNQQVADAFRSWFQFMWSICPKNEK